MTPTNPTPDEMKTPTLKTDALELARVKAWRDKNRQRTRDYAKEYRLRNLNERRAYFLKYRAANLSKIKQRIEVRKKQGELSEYYRNRRAANVQYRIKSRLSSRIRSAIARSGSSKSLKTEALIGCSLTKLKSHIESKFVPGMSWENMNTWHIDHIKPCARFNLANESEQMTCFHYENLQPMWATANIKKGARYES